MNLTQFVDEDNATVSETTYEVTHVEMFYFVFFLIILSLVLGIPGNILSAIVWLRLHAASNNSSAVYLAALAINDLVYLLILIIMLTTPGWIMVYGIGSILRVIAILEPLIVLAFSTERLIAIRCPLQACFTRLY